MCSQEGVCIISRVPKFYAGDVYGAVCSRRHIDVGGSIVVPGGCMFSPRGVFVCSLNGYSVFLTKGVYVP